MKHVLTFETDPDGRFWCGGDIFDSSVVISGAQPHYSVCVCKQLDLHIWCESHTHTHPEHPGHLSPWKLAILRLISIQTVTPGKQTSPVSRAEHTDANWCRDNIVVNLLDNPREEQTEERPPKQPAVVEGFQISVGQMSRL